ncbi:MAG: peptidylprolyl isomerase [Casimicrobiaceae bacterium]
MNDTIESTVARIDGVALHVEGEALDADTLRQRACTELLRRAAQRAGLLGTDDAPSADGIVSEAASAAIESLLAQSLTVPEPSEEACGRHFAAHAADYRTGDRAHVRHVLFAVTPGVDVRALRKRAEASLLDVRCHREGEADRFAAAAASLSNCPSGAEGGDLGWLTRDDCAPEFAREIFAGPEIGVLPRLVHSRFGLHVVEVLAREPGTDPSYESVRGALAMSLRQQSYVTALRQYLQLLAGAADVQGVALDSADTPLVQ